MNFQCEELTISDEELGCTIIFSDSKSADDQFKTIDEIMNSQRKYLLIQKTYPEDDFEYSYYHIESSESDTELDLEDKMTVRLSRDNFEISWSGDKLKIGLDLTNKELNDLKEILEVVFKERVIMEK
ncbi:hypothetical protein SAMN04487911_1682 [Arenibacter nanhaiticus]|uniref:Immunity protein 10 n=1 Tax=Arenibacter nanhaiticus TaxID=558155 RepID=A0A1M6NGQ3_9FLAO|nr:hypothetical protein [Arenibacter nanhaiticus]SHJ94847.1 hypothetical protein SAMN04487911_1682 [Arenibacter nanhaiticus]